MSLEEQYFASKVSPSFSWQIDKVHKLGTFTLKYCITSDDYEGALSDFFGAVKGNNIIKYNCGYS
jgi:hypothetical protein